MGQVLFSYTGVSEIEGNNTSLIEYFIDFKFCLVQLGVDPEFWVKGFILIQNSESKC